MGFQELLDGARSGDEESFAALWRTLNPRLLRFLAGLAGHEDAADLASETWLDAVRNLNTFEGDEAGFRGWLFTIARHRVIDLHRSRGRRAQLTGEPVDDVEGGSIDPALLIEAQCCTQAAIELIGSLPADQAEVVLLRFVADLDVPTVAKILGKRDGAVRVLSHRGLHRLADHLASEGNSHPRVTT